MISFSENLYSTKATKPSVNQIKFKIISGIGTVRLYLITLSANGMDLFDIYPAMQFKQRSMRKRNFLIVGIAESRRAAMELTALMIKDCADKTGSLDNMREYFDSFFRGG